MSIKENLKKTKKAIVMGALSLAAAAAPIKGQAKESEPAAKDTIMAMAPAEVAKKKMFEDAVRRGAPKEEIAKYVDFPEFIPVTKDGQFDSKKAAEYAKVLAPYIKTLAEKGETTTVTEVYEVFKETTGQKNVSLEDFRRICKATEETTECCCAKSGISGKIGYPIVALVAGMIALSFAYGSGMAAKQGINEIKKGYVGDGYGLNKVAAAVVSAMIAIPFGYVSVAGGISTLHAWKTVNKQVREAYARTYDSYLNQSIQAQQKQFTILDMKQAKQLIQNGQGAK